MRQLSPAPSSQLYNFNRYFPLETEEVCSCSKILTAYILCKKDIL